MTNNDYSNLKAAHDVLLSADNVAEFDKLDIKVVCSKLEEHSKYGWQCIVILQPDSKTTI